MSAAASMSRLICCATLLVFCLTIDVGAGVRDSFRDAAQSTVKYTTRAAGPARACESLRSKTEYAYTIIAARHVAAVGNVPEHCEIHGVITPQVQFWLYLPTEWNERFYMVGGGGYVGEAPQDREYYSAKIRAGVRNRFATAFTNTGHDAAYEPLGTFAYNEIQKTLDFSYRSVHLTAVTAKALIDLYYKRAPEFSYFDGCSTGGRQGLMEAQRFPNDFDGIAAGAPVNNMTDLHIWMAWIYQALDKTPIPPDKVVTLIGPKVYELCDARDGAKDGLIQDPEHCPFDPQQHLPKCQGQNRENCFSAAEMDVLKRIYGPVMSRGKPYFPGLQLGAEPIGLAPFLPPPNSNVSGWRSLPSVLDESGGPGTMEPFAKTFFRYFAFRRDESEYDWRKLNFDEDIYRMDDIRWALDAVDTDFSAFRKRGGKVISYHGWGDVGPPAAFTAKYYRDVLAANGDETLDFYRLFMVPGMFHCSGGFGTDVFDPMTPLIEWVEKGIAPASINAEQVRDGQMVRSRPLCPYPQIAKYKGSGDMNAAKSFVCSR